MPYYLRWVFIQIVGSKRGNLIIYIYFALIKETTNFTHFDEIYNLLDFIEYNSLT